MRSHFYGPQVFIVYSVFSRTLSSIVVMLSTKQCIYLLSTILYICTYITHIQRLSQNWEALGMLDPDDSNRQHLTCSSRTMDGRRLEFNFGLSPPSCCPLPVIAGLSFELLQDHDDDSNCSGSNCSFITVRRK